ncbi:MAG: SsrA-binding protein, partial [Pseudomonadota bacterium]
MLKRLGLRVRWNVAVDEPQLALFDRRVAFGDLRLTGARYDYAIEEDIECGIVLEGSEVKSLRTGKAQITECYAAVEEGELW